MPRLPMPPTDDAAYTKKQYEALGRFVEAFEAMVNECRSSSINILAPRTHAYEEEQENLANVALHHTALTAKPQFEIMRVLVAEYLQQPGVGIPVKHIDVFNGVLTDIATEYFDLVNKRNVILHGTWQVGYVSFDDPDSATFNVSKYKPTKGGLEKEKAPKDAGDLLKLKLDAKKRATGFHGSLEHCRQPITGLQSTGSLHSKIKNGDSSVLVKTKHCCENCAHSFLHPALTLIIHTLHVASVGWAKALC